MKFSMMRGLALLAGVAATGAAFAQVDGAITPAEYPKGLVATQLNPTGFGNSNLGQVGFANGSELNQMFVRSDGQFLYIGLTGNVETNFNKLTLFFDSKTGGQNRLTGAQSDQGFNAMPRMAEFTDTNTAITQPGLTFPAGFTADFAFIHNGGDVAPTHFNDFFVIGVRDESGETDGFYIGSGSYGSNGTLTGGTSNPLNTGFLAAISNLNTAGVSDSDASGAATAVTGFELRIPLSILENNQCGIRILAFVNGGGNDFMSNQFLPSLPAGTGNLGEPRLVDLTSLIQMPNILNSVSSAITFLNRADQLPTSVSLEWKEAGSTFLTSTAAVGPNGFRGIGPAIGGAYDVSVKVPGFLRTTVSVNTTNGCANLTGTIVLRNGDVNNDGIIDGNDVNAVLAQFGEEGTGIVADVNGDQIVDGNDVNAILGSFGEEDA